ncbi:branched-chain amino acid ABC transporter permease [Oscillospiraceae bacterium MB08-C2-2]|nr:branched-chain amino acid ABC transporter permease [Oscillospiraceae bacterium MB08-C2-2]
MNDYVASLIQTTCITMIGVVSIFPLTGMTGLFSFGQAAYMAVGAYVAGIAAVKFGIPFVGCLVLGVLASGLMALIVGIPTLKLRRDYFSLMSLCLGEAITSVLNKFSTVTGGAAGLSNIPKSVNLPGVIFSAALVVAMVAFYKNSRFGRMSLAIKTDELAAKSFGIDVFAHKIKVYIFTSMLAGFSGVLYAFYLTYIDPNLFGWTRSSEWVIFLFFGGVNSLTGSVISTVFLTLMPEVLRFATAGRIVMYTVMILLVINFMPQGLLGEKELSIKGIRAFFTRKTAKEGKA